MTIQDTGTRLFYCMHDECMYTLDDVESFRQMSISEGDTYAIDTLDEYINTCLVENNGELIELKTVKQITDHTGAVIYTESSVKSRLHSFVLKPRID